MGLISVLNECFGYWLLGIIFSPFLLVQCTLWHFLIVFFGSVTSLIVTQHLAKVTWKKELFILFLFLPHLLTYCVCVCICTCTCVPWCTCGGWSMTWRNQLFPSTMWIPEMELRASRLAAVSFTCWAFVFWFTVRCELQSGHGVEFVAETPHSEQIKMEKEDRKLGSTVKHKAHPQRLTSSKLHLPNVLKTPAAEDKALKCMSLWGHFTCRP